MTVDPDLATDRIVSTLNPLNLLTHNQRVFDISGLSAAWVLIGDQPTGTPLYYRRGTHRKFPAHTKGVFYYKQSVTAPGQIGELRFRLCANTLSFDEGRDLCLQ